MLHIVCCTLPQVGASHGGQEAWMGTEKSVGKGGLLPQWEGDLRVPPRYIFLECPYIDYLTTQLKLFL